MNSQVNGTVKLNLINSRFQGNGGNNFVNFKIKRNSEKK